VARHSANVDASFGVSPLTERVLREDCGIPEDRVFLVPTGVPLAPPAGRGARGEGLNLIYVGRFDEDKRALDAIELVRELKARNIAAQFTMIGSGTYLPQLQEHVTIIPPTSQSALYEEIYPNADAILLFSPVEGLPNAILEGMAHGLVPIVSDFEGREELGLLRDGETALVFPVGDMKAAVDRIAQLPRPEIGEAARRLIERERSVERMTSEFVKVLQRALAGPPRRGVLADAPLEGRSRLRGLVGPRMAERIRRMLGRSFTHVDASEWPLIDNVEAAH
jgi:glycosyltransferase involved in cell wall biosynthesis